MYNTDEIERFKGALVQRLGRFFNLDLQKIQFSALKAVLTHIYFLDEIMGESICFEGGNKILTLTPMLTSYLTHENYFETGIQ